MEIHYRHIPPIVRRCRQTTIPLVVAIGLVIPLSILNGCTTMVVGAAVGTVTTVAVETAKVPFKVTGAAIDLATDDDKDD